MLTSFFVVVTADWLDSDRNRKRLEQQRCPLGEQSVALEDHCRLFIKFRDSRDSRIRIDTNVPRLQNGGDESYLASQVLSTELREHPMRTGFGLFYFEGTPNIARCLFRRATASDFENLQTIHPHLRWIAHDVPPATTAIVDSPDHVRALLSYYAEADPELFAPYANAFLNGPHILEQLLWHLMELNAEEAPNFLTVTKGLADQLRGLLAMPSSPIQIAKVPHSHLEAWAHVQGDVISFVDGGAARIASLPGFEPAAMRVGVYSVIPGIIDPVEREVFAMETQLIADMVELSRNREGEPDRKRLQEAARYVLELVVALRCPKLRPKTTVVFLHGPLVNQFVAYDSFEPNCLPDLDEQFLSALRDQRGRSNLDGEGPP